MVRVRLAKDLDHARQRGLGAHAHVQGLYRQPPGVDPDHFSNSRSHAAQSAAAEAGHATLIVVAPRCSSMRISSAGAGGAGAASASGKNDGGAFDVALSLTGGGSTGYEIPAWPGLASASITHLRTMFAFRPLANATAAIDTPGCRQACTT